MAECSEGMSSAEPGSAILPLVALGVRILGCRTALSIQPAQGAHEVFPPLSLSVFFFTFLVALLALVTECLLTTQLTLCCFEGGFEAELRSP